MSVNRLLKRFRTLRQTLLISVLGAIAVLAVWSVLDKQRTTDFELLLSKEAELAASLLKENLAGGETAIKRLVNRWEVSGGTPENEFFADAYAYVTDFDGLESLAWIDAEYIVRWIASSTGEDISPYLNQLVEAEQWQDLYEAQKRSFTVMSVSKDDRRGLHRLRFDFPIHVDGRFDGFIRAEYNLRDWVGGVLGDTPFFYELVYSVKIDGEEAYSIGRANTDQIANEYAEARVNILGHQVNVAVSPADEFIEVHWNYGPEIALSVGCLMIVLIVTTLHFYQQSTYAETEAKTKSEFFAHMSHELRTPLNSIIGFSQMISHEVFGKIGNDKYVEYLKNIEHSSNHLLALVNDILDLSKIEAGRFELNEEDLDLGELLTSCLSMIRGRKEAQSISIEYDPPTHPLRIRGDQRALKQVVLNLLSNAVKYNVEGGKVSMDMKSSADQSITIAISDTGTGIAAADIPKVLKPFSQARTESYIAHEGTGLGLSLSKRLTELHSGQLGIDSEVGKGTTVTVWLPSERRLNS